MQSKNPLRAITNGAILVTCSKTLFAMLMLVKVKSKKGKIYKPIKTPTKDNYKRRTLQIGSMFHFKVLVKAGQFPTRVNINKVKMFRI